jgi:hypothetical protein
LPTWTRRRLRCVVWVQWKTRGNRYQELRRLNVSEKVASAAIFSPKGPLAAVLSERDAPRLHQQTLQRPRTVFHGDAGGRLIRRTAVVWTRMPGGVGGAASRDAPLSRLTPDVTTRDPPDAGDVDTGCLGRPSPITRLYRPMAASTRLVWCSPTPSANRSGLYRNGGRAVWAQLQPFRSAPLVVRGAR